MLQKGTITMSGTKTDKCSTHFISFQTSLLMMKKLTVLYPTHLLFKNNRFYRVFFFSTAHEKKFTAGLFLLYWKTQQQLHMGFINVLQWFVPFRSLFVLFCLVSRRQANLAAWISAAPLGLTVLLFICLLVQKTGTLKRGGCYSTTALETTVS